MQPRTATLHVHPTCTYNRSMIERLQAETGLLVVVSGGKPKLQPQKRPTTPFDPNDGGRAA